MPIVLGEHLPDDIRGVLAGRIDTHLTRYGLATDGRPYAHPARLVARRPESQAREFS
ncbi:hypothetical protein GCM10022233_37870 [Streptomyces shaanxiensis]|uniref:Uncharacterized protein n=1 Tax=Streptomyces shaanxiensis TaxID=653357 RepID=A0ABP7V7G1_9ACTN